MVGAGGMGAAIARRMGSGRHVLLADYNESTLEEATTSLAGDGYEVEAHRVDVSDQGQMANLARLASEPGGPVLLANTAGLSPAQVPAADILRVDLVGVAIALEEFGQVMSPGGAGVVISSMAGHMAGPLDGDNEQALAHLPADKLLGLAFLGEITDPGLAYAVAKRANHLRVQAASKAWGERGARVNSISPGIISTSMGEQELASPIGDVMRSMVDASPAGRLGTADEIASAVAFLLGPDATFVTGTDLIVDGGVVAMMRTGQFDL